MTARRYFEEEMRYLHEAGKEFAEAYPEQARYLNIDGVMDRDPFVERLFEGFAFLSGRIHEQLDNEMTDYTNGLFNLLWPHFLKPVPSLSILEFRPEPGLIQQTVDIERGTEVQSSPIGDELTACRFTTTQDVRLQPIGLANAGINYQTTEGNSQAVLRFRLMEGGGGIDYENLRLSPLRLFFHAEPSIASMMHMLFTRHVLKIAVREGTNQSTTIELRGQKWIQPGGFALEDSLLPYSQYSFSGYRLVQEYMSFRQKFWFVEIHGLEQLNLSPDTTEFQIEVTFDRDYPEDKKFKTENIRLYCTPIVNLFHTDADPIRVDHLSYEYRVVPDTSRPKSMEIYSIENVTGIEEATGKRHNYVPFYSFKHDEDKNTRYFTSITRIGSTERFEPFISIENKNDEEGKNFTREILSLDVTCTNKSLPRVNLRKGMINQPGPDFTNLTTFENLTRPTWDIHPPIKRDKDFFWKFLSHLSLNYMSIATTEALVNLLKLYDWTGSEGNKRRIAGIRDVSWQPKETVYRGAIIRGAEVTIEIQDGHFADTGDLCIFGLVMSQFFSMYASINSFIHLSILTMPSGRRFEWQPKRGTSPIA